MKNESVKAFKNRRFNRLMARIDADEDEGRWITTENGHKVHLNESGEPDIGNKHVIAAMSGGSSSQKSGSTSKTKYLAPDMQNFAKLSKRTVGNAEKKKLEQLDKAYKEAKDNLLKAKQEYQNNPSEKTAREYSAARNIYRGIYRRANEAYNMANPTKVTSVKELKELGYGGPGITDYLKSYYSKYGDTVEFKDDDGNAVKYMCVGKQKGPDGYSHGSIMYQKVSDDALVDSGSNYKIPIGKFKSIIGNSNDDSLKFIKGEYQK